MAETDWLCDANAGPVVEYSAELPAGGCLNEGTKGGSISFKVGEKGAASVYVLGRFPVTLYQEQWTKLFSHADGLKAFIEANRSKLKTQT